MSADPTTLPARPVAPCGATNENSSWRGQLPADADELTRLLDGTIAGLDQLIVEAERRAEERLRLALRASILEAFLPRIAERASCLRDLGEDDACAARMSDVLEDERLQVAATLAEFGVAPAAEPAPEVVVPADAGPEPEPAPPPDPVAARDLGPLPDPSPAHALDENEAAEEELRALVITLANEVDALEADRRVDVRARDGDGRAWSDSPDGQVLARVAVCEDRHPAWSLLHVAARDGSRCLARRWLPTRRGAVAFGRIGS